MGWNYSKFRNEKLISSHTFLACNYLSMLGLKLIHVNKEAPGTEFHHVRSHDMLSNFKSLQQHYVNLISLSSMAPNQLGLYEHGTEQIKRRMWNFLDKEAARFSTGCNSIGNGLMQVFVISKVYHHRLY